MGMNGFGPCGGDTNSVAIDSGTSCLQRSCRPGVLDAFLAGLLPQTCLMSIPVGETRRRVGFNFDGTPAEDMQFGDRPTKAKSIESDPVFSYSDEALEGNMILLMKSLSIGTMQKVALAMQKQFASGTGGSFESDALNLEIKGNKAFGSYHESFLGRTREALREVNYDPTCMPKLAMDLLNFSSFWDKVGGLGITVHQVWAAEARLNYYTYPGAGGVSTFDLEYIFYDHFGLDWEDVLKNGERRFPQYHTGDFFKCWYVLQHYRSARPFVTAMRVRMPQLTAQG